VTAGDSVPQPGDTLRMERAGTAVIVDRRLGEGAQGVVHRALLNGAPFAVKWYRPGPRADDQRAVIVALVQRGRPPHPAFVWPIDLVSSATVPGFGYLMPMMEPRFISFAQMLSQRDQPTFRVMATVGLELVAAFAALHSSGLCYRDISFGNLAVDPDAGEVAILDNDNVGTDSGDVLVKGTLRFMAPEIVRNEALPSTATDLHSLAVFLFYLFVHGHPLEGAKVESTYSWGDGHLSDGDLAVRHFGTSPLFVFDPDDASNRPLPGDPMWTWWSLYPAFFQDVFVRAFTVGLRDGSLAGRLTESVWRRDLLRLHDCVATCDGCGAAVFYDADHPSLPCWNCHGVPVPPSLLQVNGQVLVLSEGARLTSHHLLRDRDHRTTRATVEAHPGQPGQLVVRNLCQWPWSVLPDGEGPKPVAPGQRLAVRAMTIDFGCARGAIRPPGWRA
jgi:DNA-binding helix-hairpin-helix protein with protein kinase domain